MVPFKTQTLSLCPLRFAPNVEERASIGKHGLPVAIAVMREYPGREDSSSPYEHPKVSDKVSPPGCFFDPSTVGQCNGGFLEEDGGDLPEEEVKCDFGCLEVPKYGVFSNEMDGSGQKKDDEESYYVRSDAALCKAKLSVDQFRVFDESLWEVLIVKSWACIRNVPFDNSSASTS